MTKNKKIYRIKINGLYAVFLLEKIYNIVGQAEGEN